MANNLYPERVVQGICELAEAGMQDAIYALGWMYIEGKGLKQNSVLGCKFAFIAYISSTYPDQIRNDGVDIDSEFKSAMREICKNTLPVDFLHYASQFVTDQEANKAKELAFEWLRTHRLNPGSIL